MAELTIHRGTHQIGGCCTEINIGESRILIDFGANLPGTDGTSQTKDREMVQKVFGTRQDGAVLFTHYHGDHYGLFRKIPKGVPMYIGPLAKNILRILVPYIDRDDPEKARSIVEQMGTYQAGTWMTPVPGIKALPLYVDHSALDSYMFCIKAAGKTILFSGDFREHGIVGQWNRMERMLHEYIREPVDLLITEGTMLNREDEIGDTLVQSEQELGQKAGVLFQKHKYNFVLVSSTNLDSIMEFYHNTPAGMHFVCDLYQARIMITAMRDMECRNISEYRPSRLHPVVRVLGKPDSRWAQLREIGKTMKQPLYFKSIQHDELERDGFVLLARKNTHPETYTSPFDTLRDKFFERNERDSQIVYSMWKGYPGGKYADENLLRFIDGNPYRSLHTSGHAYVETIAKLIEIVQPGRIVPMHTEKADEFTSIPAFAPYRRQVQVLTDGKPLPLNEL